MNQAPELNINNKTRVTINMLQRCTHAFLYFVICCLFSFGAWQLALESGKLLTPLFPSDNKNFPWVAVSVTDKAIGGNSEIRLSRSDNQAMIFDFTFKQGKAWPFVKAILSFGEASPNKSWVNLSHYTAVSFWSRCASPAFIAFELNIADNALQGKKDKSGYRIPSKNFHCGPAWQKHKLYFSDFVIPDWWFSYHNIDKQDASFSMSKVQAMAFMISAAESDLYTSSAEFIDISLHGQNKNNLYACALMLILVWIGYLVWLFRPYPRSVNTHRFFKEPRTESLNESNSAASVTRLHVQSKREDINLRVMRYLNENYTDSEIDLGAVCRSLNTNRLKVNAVLKREIGLTFSAYLNQLRLVEARRILREDHNINVSEIAYLVGYNNASYFCKMFKAEYALTPNEYRRALDEGRIGPE